MQSARMFRTAPAVAMVAMCKTLVDWGLTPPDNDLLQSTTFLKIAESLQFMVAQLKEFDACYSKKYGLLNSAEFEAIYRQKMKVIKMKATKAKGSFSGNDCLFKLYAVTFLISDDLICSINISACIPRLDTTF
jgi:hypothetical protein